MSADERSSSEGSVATYFASPGRASAEELRLDAEACREHPVAAFLLQTLDGLVLILDAHRQVLAANDLVLQLSGGDELSILGRRPGEVFGCIHAAGGPAGCGTNHACANCGAVQAVLEVQRTGQPVHSECLLTLRRDGKLQAAEFEITASPLAVGDRKFIAVDLHDLSAAKRRESLERLFYHDVANLMQGIRGWADLLSSDGGGASNVARKLSRLIDLLDRELKSHRAMAQAEQGELKPKPRQVLPLEVLQDVGDLLRRHEAVEERCIRILESPEVFINTDPELLSRVLLNMAVNAVEASCAGDAVTLSAKLEGADVCFRVHNPGEVPESARLRIFQRSFSTKGRAGRGLGTYAMKLFGENLLGGKVGFDTGPDGTTFWIRLPR